MLNPHNNSDLGKMLGVRGMNRKRSLAEYNRELGLDIQAMAKKRVEENGLFLWYDLCCGYFVARTELLSEVPAIAGKIEAVGVDLDIKVEGVEFGNAHNFPIREDVDLVTCLQGLNYIETYLHKGAESVQHWYNSMQEGATLSFDVADRHVLVSGKDLFQYLIEELGVESFPTPEREDTHHTIKMVRGEYPLKM